jgi:hypothetical protein
MVVVPPPDVSDADFEDAIYNSAASYSQDTYAYGMIPELSGDYNSNGFIVYVLLEAGLTNAQDVVNSLPGWQPGSGQPPGYFYHVMMTDGTTQIFDSNRNYIGTFDGSNAGNLALRAEADRYWGGSYGAGYGGGGGSGAYGGGAGIGFGSIGFYGASLGLPGSFGIWGGGGGQSPAQPPREL